MTSDPVTRTELTRGPGPIGLVALLAIVAVASVLLTLGRSGVRTEATVATIAAEPLVSTTTTTTIPDALGVTTGAWMTLPEAPVRARAGPALAWTGTEMVAWGGGSSTAGLCADGAAYDVAASTWRPLAPPPDRLTERMWHTATWTATGVVVWGGHDEDPAVSSPGALYDVRNDAWTLLGSADDGERRLHSAVWTGTELLVWGGLAPDSPAPVGLAVTPRVRAAAPIPGVPIVPRWQHTAVWTGTEMIVWGGRSAEEPFPAGGAAYSPVGPTWRMIADAPIGGRTGHTAVWTGREMIVWGGARLVAATELGDGAAYYPATDTWRILPTAPIEPRRNHVAVWTGTEMIVWGGETGVLGLDGARGTVLGDGAAYDPAAGAWRVLPAAPGRGSADAVAVWAGEAGLMLIWGVDSLGQELGLAHRPG